jgi:hypothetical protein
MARQLAATLDGMDPAVAARMSGQTAGQLLKVLDKLGIQRRETEPAAHLTAQDASSVAPPPWTPNPPGTPLTDEHWYPGFEDNLYAEKLAGIIQKHAIRRGLPVPGTQAYSRNPWAVSPWQWVAEQKKRPRMNRPLAGLEGDKLAVVR